jgi:glycerol-3-phosphate dehydrogenase (NAD(P)+)
MKIGIIGAGSWGTALAITLAEKDIDVTLYVRNPEKRDVLQETRENHHYLPGCFLPDNIVLSSNLQDAIEGVSFTLLAVPTQQIRRVLKQLKPITKHGHHFVNVAKGLENSTLLRISEIFKEELPEVVYGILSGPSHAEEVAKKMPTTITVASVDSGFAKLLQETFTTEFLRIYRNDDLTGVELGGALKNVIAIGAGISDGLGYGDNTKAALMNRGIVEITRLGEAMGALRNTFLGLSGMGDLIVTCMSKHSRNRRAGILLAKGMSLEETIEKIGMAVEGAETVKAAVVLARQYQIEMPITEEIYKVLYGTEDVSRSVYKLMMRDSKPEWD